MPTSTRRRPPVRRRRKRRGLVEQAVVDLGVVCGRLAWRGAKGVARWSGRHGLALTVRAAKAAGAPVRSWADDYRRFGHLGHADCGCGWHGPPSQLAAHEAEHDGETPATRPARPSGDRVRDGEPRRRVRAQATRLDREPATGGARYECPHCHGWAGPPAGFRHHIPSCPGLHPDVAVPTQRTEAAAAAATTGKEIQVSEWNETDGLQALLDHDIDDSRDFPELLRTIKKGFGDLCGPLGALAEDARAHQIVDTAVAKLAELEETVAGIADLLEQAAGEVDEQVESMPTYGLERAS